ncbi:NEDD4-binding protein 2-like [Dreissena polymorpha]|uniref:Smr domain-containing protein n=1 Tax=Dreissena polymorpha TaxID=45954 RepID=A0A9D4MBL8_DREPO|nr:NEDD4-binding protein 2-like [Dreissena polymorpha]KAH3872081.1 hypothetical protein DPMN_035294 [Dreissena polymorpha]
MDIGFKELCILGSVVLIFTSIVLRILRIAELVSKSIILGISRICNNESKNKSTQNNDAKTYNGGTQCPTEHIHYEEVVARRMFMETRLSEKNIIYKTMKAASNFSTTVANCAHKCSTYSDKIQTAEKTNQDEHKVKKKKNSEKVVFDIGDGVDVEYDNPITKEGVINKNRYRQEASEHAKRRNHYFELAKSAFTSGDKQGASTYSKLGHSENGKMRQANKKAADLILKTLNKSFPKCLTLDLHGLYVSEALNFLNEFIEAHLNEGVDEVQIITGKGNHSDNGRPRLRPTIMEHLKKKGFMYTEDKVNTGEFTVHLMRRSALVL